MKTKQKEFKENKTRNPFKLIPWYGWIGALITLAMHIGLYKLAYALVSQYADSFWSFCPKIPEIDDKIPFVPYFFIEMYVIGYAAWVVFPLIISTGSKKNFTNFMFYNIISHLIVFVLFLTMPTWQNRSDVGPMAENMQEKLDSIKTPISKLIMSLVISGDGNDTAWNMAPSYHVLTALVCMFGVLKRKDIHVAARVTTYAVCTPIIMSTVFVKQHYLFDVLFAIALGSIVYIIIMLFKPGNVIVDKYPNFLVIKKNKAKAKKV